MAPEVESAGADIAVAADGTRHAGWSGYDGETKDSIFYAVCTASDCDRGSAWSTVELPSVSATTVQVEVTPEGNPRLLIIGWAAEYANGSSYTYAECDADCLEPASWSLARLAVTSDDLFANMSKYDLAERTFALDDAGRPRFLYMDANYSAEPDHYGTFYMACDMDCTDSERWAETNLARQVGYNTEGFTRPVLALGKGGQAGVLAQVYAFDDTGEGIEAGLWYYACADDCTRKDNWRRTFVIDYGGGSYPSPSWDLEIASDGQPRLALFTGEGMDDAGLDHQLIYAWCIEDCTESEHWVGNPIGIGEGHGEGVDLELDNRDVPHIALITSSAELAYGACTGNCEVQSKGDWTVNFAELADTAAAGRPAALPYHCDAELWNGHRPQLELDGTTAVLAYDITVDARCLYKVIGEPEISSTFHEIWRGSRVVVADAP